MPKCKGCGAEIVFIKTTKGKCMPCDSKPVTYWATKDAKRKIITPNGEVVSCEFNGDADKATGIGYIPHWATCPAAKQFKTRNSGRRLLKGGEGNYGNKQNGNEK